MFCPGRIWHARPFREINECRAFYTLDTDCGGKLFGKVKGRAMSWRMLDATRPIADPIARILLFGATGFVTGMLTGRVGAGHVSVLSGTRPPAYPLSKLCGVYSVCGVAQLAVLVVRNLFGRDL
jgi:hypothetical protein